MPNMRNHFYFLLTIRSRPQKNFCIELKFFFLILTDTIIAYRCDPHVFILLSL